MSPCVATLISHDFQLSSDISLEPKGQRRSVTGRRNAVSDLLSRNLILEKEKKKEEKGRKKIAL